MGVEVEEVGLEYLVLVVFEEIEEGGGGVGEGGVGDRRKQLLQRKRGECCEDCLRMLVGSSTADGRICIGNVKSRCFCFLSQNKGPK
jgi:hypothetical protein